MMYAERLLRIGQTVVRRVRGSSRQTQRHILVSFANVVTPGRCTLGLLDVATMVFRKLALPPELGTPPSITGLAASRRYIFAALQTSPLGTTVDAPGCPAILVFDRARLTLLNHHPLPSAADVHSLWVTEQALYVVSTGTDEILGLRLDDADVVGERVCWRPDPAGPRLDLYHLNTVSGWRGELLVAGFGRKAGSLWSTATDGFIANVTRGTTLISGIHHPHSLMPYEERLYFCESRARAVRAVGDVRHQRLPGYTRGLCRIGRRLFVGTSKGRQVSKSTGMINNSADPGTVAGQCAVSRLHVNTLAIETTVDLSAYGEEIYDLLPVEDATNWPIDSP
jgi:uncharacterized protein DUF4915